MLFMLLFVFLPSVFTHQDRLLSPCNLEDLGCIRNVLARNSDCDRAVWGSVPDVVSFNNVQFELPNFNCSFSDQYQEFRNLKQCYVSAFSFNLVRNRAVLSVSCPNVTFETQNRGFKEHNPLKEDAYYYFAVQAKYSLVTYTVDLPHADELNVCETYAFPYIAALPVYYYVEGKDPASERFKIKDKAQLFPNFQTFAKEAFSQLSNNIFRYWVNNVLCNFDNYCRN